MRFVWEAVYDTCFEYLKWHYCKVNNVDGDIIVLQELFFVYMICLCHMISEGPGEPPRGQLLTSLFCTISGAMLAFS